jgi:general secretion pathway protein M
MFTTLPAGRLGRAIALSATLLAVLVIWLSVVQPLRDWYDDGAAALERRSALASRMAALAAQIPALSRRTAELGAGSDPSASLLSGDTDAIAGAKLQEIVQGLAETSGVAPTSIENLPALPAGHYRRIGLRLALVARFPVLVQLLQSATAANPRMLVDDLHVESAHLISQPVDAPLDAQLTIYAFRLAGNAPPAP